MVDSNSRRLADRYEVRSLIGRGGMAQVHLGFDTRLSRVVAIKMLRIDLARDATFQTRFRREAQASASLNHPNIVGVYDTGEETVATPDGGSVRVPYIVMEYVEGHTVKELLSDGTPVPIDEGVEITSGVLSALEYAHAAGLVHRDIKPGNIMLTKAGQVKVMDFGIARAMTDSQATMTQTNAVVGTAQYLSPEQARGERVDERSDIYSAGCVLFELLTGRPPFKGDTAVSVAYQHVSETPPAPSTFASDIPESLDRVTLKAMAKNADDRYSSAAEMRADLVRAAQGMDVTAPATAVWAAPVAVGAATQLMEPTADATTMVPATDGSASDLETTQTGQQEVLAQKPKRRRWGIIALVVLALALVAVALYLIMSPRENTQSAPRVAIPMDLVGQPEAEAMAALTELGLQPTLGEPVNSDTVAEGAVAETDPKPGSIVRVGSTVTLRISHGSATAQIPDMAGWRIEEVRAKLTELGFVVGSTSTEESAGRGEGELIRTDPPAGSAQPRGSTVNLVFASGRVTVPSDLVGTESGAAQQRLAGLQLSVSVVEAYSATVPAGTVISANPTGPVQPGTTVTLTVSKGPEQVEPQQPPQSQ